jgi:HAE1 family hydrophobic/amphiphilic exporter-1
MVFGVLWVALGLRNAVLAIIDIPFCFLTAFLLLWWQGVSINALSLFALVLVNGIMVDDAIVVIENIYHHVQQGVPLRRAVIDGTREVMWPVINATSTTVLAFLPLFMMTGIVGKFFSVIPTVVTCTLLASLVDTLIMLPAHYLDFGSRRARANRGLLAWIGRLGDWIAGRLNTGYMAVLGWVLAHRGLFLGLLLAVSVFFAGLAAGMPIHLFPSDFQLYFVSIETTPNCSIAETGEVLHRFETLLEAERGKTVQEYLSLAGFAMSSDGVFMVRPNLAQSYVNLEQRADISEDPALAVQLMTERIERELRERPIPNLLSWSIDTPKDGPPVGKPVAIRIQGPDYATAKRIALEYEGALHHMAGVSSIADNLVFGQPQVTVQVDESRASVYGLTFLDVAVALQGANDGLVVGSFKDERLDEDVDIRVKYAARYRSDLNGLLETDVKTPGGAILKMRDLTRTRVMHAAPSLYHYDSERTVLVTADLDPLVTTSVAVNTALQAQFADIERRFPGYRVIYGGEFEETRSSFASLKIAYVLALLLIYGNLAAEFRSYWQPLLIMTTIPFSFLAAVTGLMALSMPFTVTTFIAMTGLAGVVVNDAIVLLDMVNQRRRAGDDALTAVLAACDRRMRPVFLTVSTTVLGLLPTAMGWSGKSLVWSPFAISFAWGLTFDTVLTLLLVPVLYVTIDGLRLKLTGEDAPETEDVEPISTDGR